jgi:hypothetical protein
MIDLDELERRIHEAFRSHTDMDDMDEWRDAVLALNDALRVAAPELLAMARTLERVRKSIKQQESLLPALLTSRPGSYARGYDSGTRDTLTAIDAAMEQKP